MKKNIFRTLAVVGAFTLMSFSESESTTESRRPMFGGKEECMPAIRMPNGDCTRECRQHTYIFWIDFVGEWHTVAC